MVRSWVVAGDFQFSGRLNSTCGSWAARAGYLPAELRTQITAAESILQQLRGELVSRHTRNMLLIICPSYI